MCNPRIQAGKFESGASVSPALYARQAGASQELAALFAFDGNVVPTIVTTIICGSPSPKPGLAFAQFALPQPDQLL